MYGRMNVCTHERKKVWAKRPKPKPQNQPTILQYRG